MNVYVEKNTEQDRWWVRLDDCRVSFNTCAEAEQFVERLTSRLNAPHSLDMLANRPSRERSANMNRAKGSVAASADLRFAKEA
ncbi:hypothetical protein K8374_10970 [Pseudomonas sp. p1(2021b)]|uniref:hypothetical protein n=1 Tax=Pseudomonas sp. p1(2021b) TaxID=2874628 RepID=UPI001CCE86EB|nr:hypothetical protein [Pseudomonas sp. p1(2021b)]UBM27437.1 hypothetical protein K8374_10970 [Pseudomonas sp. p1(2021b)]